MMRMSSWSGVWAGLLWSVPVAAPVLAADTLICDVAQCASIGLATPQLLGNPGQPVNEWAKSQIWGYTEDILQVVGLQPNFILIETGQVSNAAALIQDGRRVLAYNPVWLKGIAATQKWAMYGLLCHEIGHHLQGHTLLPGGSKPPTELEADRYAGFVLAKLGATQGEAISLWQTLSESGSATHPARADRIANVAQGWQKGSGPVKPPPASPPPPQSDYVIGHSASRRLSEADLAGLSPALLRIARNEIFARHGYRFEAEDLQSYFQNRPWYAPRTGSVVLGNIEKDNVTLIKSRELAGGGEPVAVGFIFPHSSNTVLQVSEVENLSADKRRYARNEIFARNGYIFNDPKLDAYFRKMSWYRPTQRDVTLSPVEQANVTTIRSLE
jgi:hypothetical protein